MEPLLNSSSYILVPKKNFVRYALPYEVLPTFMCCEVNQKKVFDKEIAKSLFSQESVANENLILEVNTEDNDEYISFSNIKKVYFSNQENLDLFLERSYENYDVNSLDCYILALGENDINTKVDIIYPSKINKSLFTRKMALRDSVIGLIYEKLKNNTNLQYFFGLLKSSIKLNEIINLLFDSDLNKSIEKEIQIDFFKICSEYNLTEGWNPINIVSDFENKISENIKTSSEFQAWVLTVKKIINGDNVNIVFDDNGNITLRAMTLVLLNPEIFQLESIKNNSNFVIGDNVYKLALKFLKARLGYSYLSADDRMLVGENRELLQDIISYVYNLDETSCDNYLSDKIEIKNTNQDKQFNILKHGWLKTVSEDQFKIIFSIKGIKPIAGFSLDLIYEKEEKLLLRIIDRNSPKGMTKFKGQLALNIIELQKDLPDNSRFEVNDQGLVLILPLLWINEINLSNHLKEVFDILKPLAIAQKSSKLIDDVLIS